MAAKKKDGEPVKRRSLDERTTIEKAMMVSKVLETCDADERARVMTIVEASKPAAKTLPLPGTEG